jgi:predicted aldo/keto reductase-like oxidoreductase
MNNPDSPLPYTRRGFLKSTLAAGAGAGLASAAWAAPTEERNGIPYRTLGRTGEKVSMVGIGGFHIGGQFLEGESIKIIRTALDSGISFLDNCWDYNGGNSEIRMGKALRDGYREKAFLMTKIDGRNKATAASQIDQSLQRLQTDHVDLMQFHEVIRMDDPDRIFADGGAMEAMLEARKAGKVRYIGFTGHKSPDIHLKMLRVAEAHGFHFDTVQMPLNVMDAHFDSFTAKVLPVLTQSGIAPLAMKPMGDKIILESKTVTPVECLRYAMNLPVSVVITGCDSLDILNQAINTAKSFKPLSQQEVADILAKTAPVAQSGQYELYKTSNHFDSTAKNPEFLG